MVRSQGQPRLEGPFCSHPASNPVQRKLQTARPQRGRPGHCLHESWQGRHTGACPGHLSWAVTGARTRVSAWPTPPRGCPPMSPWVRQAVPGRLGPRGGVRVWMWPPEKPGDWGDFQTRSSDWAMLRTESTRGKSSDQCPPSLLPQCIWRTTLEPLHRPTPQPLLAPLAGRGAPSF